MVRRGGFRAPSHANHPLRIARVTPERTGRETLEPTAEIAAALPGPNWLQSARRAAIGRFAAGERPSFEQETWRYSPIDDLDLDAYDLPAPSAAPADLAEVGLPDGVARVQVRNGSIVDIEVADEYAAKGVVVGRLADVDDGDELLGAVLGTAPDVMVELATGLAADPIVVRVPDGVVLDGPVVVSQTIDEGGALVASRLVISAGADSQFEVLDHQRSADVEALVLPVVEVGVAGAARVGYLNIQDLGPQVWQLGLHAAEVAGQASFTGSIAAFGGGYARVRADCRLTGRGASGDLLSLYFGEGEQTLDFRTFQHHIAPDCTSNLLFKGALDDASRSVYSGLIKVGPEARGTDAYQTNRNIKLSPDAWAESVPNLEIENNDVRCSHASAVGPIDEEQEFYLESRGVPPEAAERLIVTGFFDEVVRRLPVPGARPIIDAKIAASLDHHVEVAHERS